MPLSQEGDALAPPVDAADLLLLVFHHLRRRGLVASAVSLLRESGVDPFWLCGPSRELALLREWVFAGQFARARSLLEPLRPQLPADQFAALLGEIGKLQVLEHAFAGSVDRDSGANRRELLRQLLARAREGVETLGATEGDDQSGENLPFLRSCDAQECLDVILASTSASNPKCGRWSRFEARLRCVEAILRACRDEIAPDEREHKYEAVAGEQLEWLVQDALLFHGQRDCVALQTRAGAIPAPSGRPDDGEDVDHALYLSTPVTERADADRDRGKETKTRRGGDRQVRASSVARSVDCLPVAPLPPAALKTAVAPLPIPTKAVPDRERMRRKRHPLIASMDVKCMGSMRGGRRADPLPPFDAQGGEEQQQQQLSERQQDCRVDAGTNTEPPTREAGLPTSAEAATTARVDVEEESTQTEAKMTATCELAASYGQEMIEPPSHDDPLLPDASQNEDGGGVSPHHDSDEDVGDKDDGEQLSADDGLDPDDDDDDGDDLAASTHDEPPSSPLEYGQLEADHVVRARVVAEGKEAHAVRAMDVHRSGRQLAIGTNARALRLLDLSTPMSERSGAKPAAFAHHHLPLLPVVSEWHKHQRAPIYCVAFHREALSRPLLASGDADGSIKVLRLPFIDHRAAGDYTDTASDNVVWAGRHEGKLRSLRFSPTASGLLWSAASGDRSIRCWDVSRSLTSPLLALDGHVGEIQALTLAPSASSLMLSAALDRTLRVWDARSGRCERLLASGLSHAALAVEFHPRSATVVAAGHQDGSVSLWDLRGATFASSSWHQLQQSKPDGRGSSAALVYVTQPHQDECRTISWAPCGRWLLSGAFDGSVCFMSTGCNAAEAGTATLEPVASFRQHRDKVLQALWHPTAPAVVTSGADKSVKLWRFD